MFAILTAIYLLFYLGTTVILEHAELKEQTHLLQMQSRQYRALQEHMRQTTRLRHDFRHSVHLLSSLAKEGDISSRKVWWLCTDFQQQFGIFCRCRAENMREF